MLYYKHLKRDFNFEVTTYQTSSFADKDRRSTCFSCQRLHQTYRKTSKLSGNRGSFKTALHYKLHTLFLSVPNCTNIANLPRLPEINQLDNKDTIDNQSIK